MLQCEISVDFIPDEPQSLQTQWKRVRDRYVRERRKRRNAGQDLSVSCLRNPHGNIDISYQI